MALVGRRRCGRYFDAGRHCELVAVGGSALLALGLITRPMKDVDIVAVADGGRLRTADPLPRELLGDRDRVARDFDLADDWINAGPTGLLELGLPEGFSAGWRRETSATA